MHRGVRSLLSFRLFVRRGSLGALNLYGGETKVFDEESILVGEVLAQHASVALARLNSEARFQRALDSRDIIGQAKGLLMQRQGLSEQVAYEKLRKTAMDKSLKVVEVAQRMLDVADLLG